MVRCGSLVGGGSETALLEPRIVPTHLFASRGWFGVVRSGSLWCGVGRTLPRAIKKNSTANRPTKKTLLPFASIEGGSGWLAFLSECCGLCRGTSESSEAPSARAESHSDNLPLQPRVVRAPLRSNREWCGAVRPVSGEGRNGSGWFAVVRSGADTPSLYKKKKLDCRSP